MSDERKAILEMLRDGRISVAEAEWRLDRAQGGLAMRQANVKPEIVHVLVTRGPEVRADVRVPLALAKVGLKFGKGLSALVGKYGLDEEDAMRLIESLDIDEIVEALRQGDIALPYKLMEAMTEKNERITVIIESK